MLDTQASDVKSNNCRILKCVSLSFVGIIFVVWDDWNFFWELVFTTAKNTKWHFVCLQNISFSICLRVQWIEGFLLLFFFSKRHNFVQIKGYKQNSQNLLDKWYNGSLISPHTGVIKFLWRKQQVWTMPSLKPGKDREKVNWHCING